MKRRRDALLVAWALAAACAAQRPPPPPPPPPPPLSPAAQLVQQADDAVKINEARTARDLYTQVLKDYPNDPAAFDARYGLAMLRVDPKSPLLDYDAARVNFDRLVARYGKQGGDWLREAQAWRAVLRRLDSCEEKTAKLEADLEQMKDLGADVERLRELEADVQRLREVEKGLETEP
jgi:hypothetical protein